MWDKTKNKIIISLIITNKPTDNDENHNDHSNTTK